MGAAFASLAAACDSTSPQTGRLSVLLTDAPGDFHRAVVTISEIYLQGGDDGDGRVVLSSTETTTDLLTLANSTRTLVDDVEIPARRYGQLRFVITGGYIEVENADGSTSIYASSPDYEGLPAGAVVSGPLQMPSFAQSGLKVTLPGDFEVGGEARALLVDFDVAESFGHRAGGGWVMHPVVRATSVTSAGTVGVTLRRSEGLTMPTVGGRTVTLGDFVAELTDVSGNRETLALTDGDGDGEHEARFEYLLPGDYTVDLRAPAGVSFATTPARPAAVIVESGEEVETSFTLTTATAP